MKAGTLIYKPIGIGAGIVGGMAAGALFRKVWRTLGYDGKKPSATAADFDWAEVVAAAALEAVIFAVVKTTVDRGAAVAFHKMTGVWPGK